MEKSVVKFRWTKCRSKGESHGQAICTLLVDDLDMGDMRGGGKEMRWILLLLYLSKSYGKSLQKILEGVTITAWLGEDEQTRNEVLKSLGLGLSLLVVESSVEIWILETHN